ncbi:MAG: hypothetical protein AAF399_06555 [Bacteroidota bacterium]
MKGYAETTAWHETIVLFFEDFQADPDVEPEECEEAFIALFDWQIESGALSIGLRTAAAKVLMDEYVAQNFRPADRYRALAWLFEGSEHNRSLRKLLIQWATPQHIYHVWQPDSPPPPPVQWLEVDREVEDFVPLADLAQLRYANLNDTSVVDLAPLEKLTNLNWLSLTQTGVVDLAPLEKLKNLSELSLTQTGVVDLAPLKALKSLGKVSLIGTNVSDAQIRALEEALSRCQIISAEQ